MKRTHELHATAAEWIDEATGNKCKRTIIIGSLYVSKNGNQVIKLEAIPVSRDFSGWISVRPITPSPPSLPPGRKVSPGMPPAPSED